MNIMVGGANMSHIEGNRVNDFSIFPLLSYHNFRDAMAYKKWILFNHQQTLIYHQSQPCMLSCYLLNITVNLRQSSCDICLTLYIFKSKEICTFRDDKGNFA